MTTPVAVAEHPTLNSVKGTIYYRNKFNYTDQELIEELAPYSVTDIYRTSRKVSGDIIPMNIYIVTFKRRELPTDVHIGWKKCRVEEYIPKPLRFYRCQGLTTAAEIAGPTGIFA